MPDGAQLSPQEFAAKIKAKYPAYASIPDDQLVEKITSKYPQYKAQIKTAPLQIPDAISQSRASIAKKVQPLTGSEVPSGPTVIPTASGSVPGDWAQAFADPRSTERTQQALASARPGMTRSTAEITGSMVGGAAVAPLAESAGAAAGTSKILRFLLPLITRASGAGVGAGAGAAVTGAKPKEALATAGTFAGMEAGGELGLAGATKAAKAIIPKSVDPLTKINNLLGVRAKEVKLGKTPLALDEFATNPARGVKSAGLDEAALKDMNPLERNKAITEARDRVGKQLDEVLKKASQPEAGGGLPEQAGAAGTSPRKVVNVQKIMDNVFKNTIPDEALAKQTAKRFQQIISQAGLEGKLLSQLTPYEARTLQRGLDEFANYSTFDNAKTFKEVATALRRQISQETRRIVPESAILDQQYGDLAAATTATRRQATDFARTTPESKLRKWIIKAAVKGIGVIP